MAGPDPHTEIEPRRRQRRRASRPLLGAALGATAAFLLTAAPAMAASVTYYASPTGSGDCSSAASACSLATAQTDAAGAGNAGKAVTIVLAAGTYSASPPEIDVTSGSESSLTFQGAGMSSTILTGGGGAQTALLNVAFPITVEDLELEDGSAASTPSEHGGDLDDEPTSTNAMLTVQDVFVLGGQAAYGGGIYFGDGGTLTIVDSEIVDNSIPPTLAASGGYGAGLFTEATSFTQMMRSAVIDNSDDGGPGGAGISSSSAGLSIQDSTIAGNMCSSVCNGTALRVGLGTSQIFGGTIQASTSSSSSQLYVDETGVLQIGGSIVTGNPSAECAVAGAPTPGQIVDEGYNIADDNTNCELTASTSQPNVTDQEIGLGTLTENGGPTPTMQVTSSSAAYDIVPTSKTLTADDTVFCSRYDERGIPRAQTGASACSAGAYQFAPPTLSLVVPSSDEAGRTVTIAGSNLQYAGVTFGSGDAPGTVSSPSPTEITATVPILSPGSQPITVTNADGSAQLPFTLLANPQVTTASLPDAERGVAYTGQLNASGGAPPLTWTASSPLPAGLTLGPNGVIVGTPTATGGPFDVAVSDSNGVTATQSLQITVVPAVAIATSSLRSAVAGVPYGVNLQVGAGTGEGPYEWSIAGGSLPAGLGLAPGGEISGVPTLAGRATFVLKVTDGLGGSAQVSLNLTVTPGASPAPELTHLRQTHKVFAVGSGATTLSARDGGRGKPVKKTAVGTVFSFTLSQAARVTIEIKPLGIRECTKGRAKRSKCVAPIPQLKRSAHAGPDRIVFSGRVGRRALAPGRYRASFVASNARGSSRPRTLTFTIVRR